MIRRFPPVWSGLSHRGECSARRCCGWVMDEMRDRAESRGRSSVGRELPLYVERTEFDTEGRRMDLYLAFRKGGRSQCPECRGGCCPAHDATEKSWRHLNFFQHEAPDLKRTRYLGQVHEQLESVPTTPPRSACPGSDHLRKVQAYRLELPCQAF